MRIKLFLLLAFGFLLFTIVFILYPKLYTLTPTHAQSPPPCPVQSPNPRVQNGLISTADISRSSGKFSNTTGTCAVDPGRIAYAPFKIPNFDDLKSLYFDQAKSQPSVNKQTLSCNPCRQSDIPLTGGSDHLYSVPNDLIIDGNIPGGGSQVGVVFVSGSLSINQNITSGGPNSGLVFVVKGDVNIASSVTQINAVIISQGIIYTAGAGCSSPVSTSALTINGSLISLNPDVSTPKIKFCRTLSDNSQPAEVINQQAKYLVILRNIYSDTLQKWSEIQ